VTVLDVRDLRRSFGGIHAVQGVSFTLENQEIVGIIGPNGSGKSTMFNLLTGLIRPSSGTVLLGDRDITGWKPHRIARAGMGRTFQIPALFVNMTVRENLYASVVEGDWKRAGERAELVLDLMKLGELRNELAGALSGGQQRLLEFGRILMRDPRVILLDEVTAGVHPDLRQTILEAITRLRSEGRSFLVIEHNMELVRAVCERVIVMDAGQVVARGSFDEISSDKNVVEAYLGMPVR
jgi:branched-chain amino acid transport system ATP-binding protein